MTSQNGLPIEARDRAELLNAGRLHMIEHTIVALIQQSQDRETLALSIQAKLDLISGVRPTAEMDETKQLIAQGAQQSAGYFLSACASEERLATEPR